MFIFIVSKVLNQVAVWIAIYIKMINKENISLRRLINKPAAIFALINNTAIYKKEKNTIFKAVDFSIFIFQPPFTLHVVNQNANALRSFHFTTTLDRKYSEKESDIILN